MTFQDALCRGDHELFDATDTASHLIARAICAECPAIRECAALRDEIRSEISDTMQRAGGGPVGTWAGELLGGNVTPITHGTESGYLRHLAIKEVPCEPCREARASAARARYHARKVATQTSPVDDHYPLSRADGTIDPKETTSESTRGHRRGNAYPGPRRP